MQCNPCFDISAHPARPLLVQVRGEDLVAAADRALFLKVLHYQVRTRVEFATALTWLTPAAARSLQDFEAKVRRGAGDGTQKRVR